MLRRDLPGTAEEDQPSVGSGRDRDHLQGDMTGLRTDVTQLQGDMAEVKTTQREHGELLRAILNRLGSR
jgi:hypothetical protein